MMEKIQSFGKSADRQKDEGRVDRSFREVHTRVGKTE